VQALGFSVPDLDATTAEMKGRGCRLIGEGPSLFGTMWTTLRDVNGVTLDLVADAAVPAGESRMRHLRVTCADLARSLSWYEGLGFELLGEEGVDDGAVLGVAVPVDAIAAHLRLPDEPFELLLVEWREPASYGRHVTEPNHAGLFRAAIGVDDTRGSYQRMSDAGWEFDRAPMLVELNGTPVPDMWICFTSDPDGVPFEFVERPRTAFRA
ncbi:MAG: VOC family protein, partial [Acidimicrobiales bacterium]